MKNRLPLLAPAVCTLALWIAGLAVADDNISDSKTDPQILAFMHDHKNHVLLGGWLFMAGCISFLWFAAMLRERLADAEGGAHTLTNLCFGGAIAVAALGIGTQSDIATAINVDHVSAASAGAIHHLGDLFFVGAELLLIPVLVASAVLAFRTGVLPRWWAVLSGIVSVVLVIGPIGWVALIFGLPIWTLGTSMLVGRAPRARTQVSPSAA